MDTHIIAAGWSPWDANNTNPAATTRYNEYDSRNITNTALLNLSGRVGWAHILTATEAARYSTANIFGPASYWGSSYTNWGAYVAWDPVASLNSVPAQ